MSVKRSLAPLARHRVSVLDLDNICSFRQADGRLAEETAAQPLAKEETSKAPNRDLGHTRPDQTVLILYLSLRCQTGAPEGVTLTSDWTAKHR
jgi:hypothetical protein